MEWLTPERAVRAIWAAWILFIFVWIWMSRSVKRTMRRESLASGLSYRVPTVIGFALMWLPLGGMFGERLLALTPGPLAVAATLNWAGILFAIWARVYLGRNWSATVTVKEGHELIRTGPYRIVRHPIYARVLMAFLGLAAGRLQAIAGLTVVFLSFLLKSRIEEGRMIAQFGPQYEEYRRGTKALIPFIV